MRIAISSPVILSCSVLLVWATSVAAWEPKRGPLMTRFARDVDPRSPMPEYPRPQLVRADWLSLNGVWQYQPGREGNALPSTGKQLASEILVPFPVESALSGVMEHHERLWYRRTFTLPAGWAGRRVILHFDAVDYEAEVWVNGKSAGPVHTGGYDGFGFDITPLLNPTGSNQQEVVVRVFDPTEAGGQPRGKQAVHRGPIMYTPTTGIWQTVWLEPVPDASVTDLHVVPDVDASAVRVKVNATDPAATVRVQVRDGPTVVATADGKPGAELTIPVPSTKLWSPDQPFLYDLDVGLTTAGGTAADHVTSYFGMRKVALGDDHGVKKVFLNNRPYFQFGTLDQGFWPDGIYTPPTDAAMRNDIAQMKAMGFNMVRKHIKVEPARWYYWTDHLGLLVWQDMPSCDSYLPRGATRPAVDKAAYASELKRMIRGHWNAPSIIMWVAFNENQGLHDTGSVVASIRRLDPSRLVDENSGGPWSGGGDVSDTHSYPEPGCLRPTSTRASVCGETGAIALQVPGHQWTDREHYGQVDAATPDELAFLFNEYAQMAKGLRDDRGLSGVVYTQWTDVEAEVNGLLTYDRIPKLDPAAVAAMTAFRRPPATYRAVLPTSEATGQTWRFTTDKPPADWATTGFDDNAWATGPAPFARMPSATVRTPWTTDDVWLRRHFDPGPLTAAEIARLLVRIRYSGDVQVYLNGQLACTRRQGTATYRITPIADAARSALRPGANNEIAVHCHQPRNDRFIDVGLSLREG